MRRDARLMLVGLISFADDQGRFLASSSAIAGYVFPHDDLPAKTIRMWRDEIAASGVIQLYNVGRSEYGYFPKWEKHQKINRASDSIIPEPSLNGTRSRA